MLCNICYVILCMLCDVCYVMCILLCNMIILYICSEQSIKVRDVMYVNMNITKCIPLFICYDVHKICNIDMHFVLNVIYYDMCVLLCNINVLLLQ